MTLAQIEKTEAMLMRQAAEDLAEGRRGIEATAQRYADIDAWARERREFAGVSLVPVSGQMAYESVGS